MSLRISYVRSGTASWDYNLKKNVYPTIQLFQQIKKIRFLIFKSLFPIIFQSYSQKRFWEYNINTITANYEDRNTCIKDKV